MKKTKRTNTNQGGAKRQLYFGQGC